jgi:drug/metabolite transporter (DMT)-like permease
VEIIGLAAALGTAVVWAISSLVSTTPARALGSLPFNRIRQLVVFVMLAGLVTLLGRWQSMEAREALLMVASGLVGIFLGDTALFATLARLGPRRTQLVFSSHAPLTVLLGLLFLGESLSLKSGLGSLLVVVGIWIAIVYGKRRAQLHTWEQVRGPLWTGVAFGLLAASGQALGVLIAKPLMDTGVDPLAAAALRVGAAGFCLSVIRVLPFAAVRAQTPLTPRLFWLAALSGFLGMGLGMSLYMIGLTYTSAGNVAILSSTVPVLTLPLLWLTTRERPALMAFVGAALAFSGTGMIIFG